MRCTMEMLFEAGRVLLLSLVLRLRLRDEEEFGGLFTPFPFPLKTRSIGTPSIWIAGDSNATGKPLP